MLFGLRIYIVFSGSAPLPGISFGARVGTVGRTPVPAGIPASVCPTLSTRAEFIPDEAATRCYFGALASQAGPGTHGGLKKPGRLTVGGCVARYSEAGTAAVAACWA